MTTPTTPAADAHKFFAYADKIGHWYDGPETFVICKAKHVQLGAQTYGPPQAVESRESALIADYQRLMDKHNALHVNAQAVRVERDALLIAGGDLANCAYNLAQRSGEVLSARSAVALDNARRKWDAALAAPAVEGV